MRGIDRGRWLRVALGVALGLVLFAGWLVVLGVVVGQGVQEKLEPFTGPAVWTHEDWVAHPRERRGDMASDFAARDLAAGLTRDGVVALLGAPDRDEGTRLVYVAGWHELLVSLDGDGTVHDTSVRVD